MESGGNGNQTNLCLCGHVIVVCSGPPTLRHTFFQLEEEFDEMVFHKHCQVAIKRYYKQVNILKMRHSLMFFSI